MIGTRIQLLILLDLQTSPSNAHHCFFYESFLHFGTHSLYFPAQINSSKVNWHPFLDPNSMFETVVPACMLFF